MLQDPTCEEPRTSLGGGCAQRRCDKDITPHEKVCVDDSPDKQCTIDECELKCAQKTFTDQYSEAYCTHWAYDAVDKECYLFYGCTGEQYDDDYTLFTQNYGERLDLEKLGARNTWPVSPAESSKVVGAFTFLAAAALLAV